MLELDVFTLFPHWFAWLSEERPVQNALANGLRLGFHSYRDYSPLKHRAVDDAPFGGGAGMVLRVDVVAAAVGVPTAHRSTRCGRRGGSWPSTRAAACSTTRTRASWPPATG